MADDFFKGLGRYIPPEIRRFSPAIKTVADILRPTQIVKNPAVSNLVRSPSLANLGTVLSNTAMTAAEVVPGGKLVTTPVKKASKLVDDFFDYGYRVKPSKTPSKDPLGEKIEKDFITFINRASPEDISKMSPKQLDAYLSDHYVKMNEDPNYAKYVGKLFESGSLKKASDIPYKTVDDQLELISKKKDRKDKLSTVKRKRAENIVRSNPATEQLFKYNPNQLSTSEMERLSKNPLFKAIFKGNIIKSHALEQSAVKVIPEIQSKLGKNYSDFKIYELIPEKILEKGKTSGTIDLTRPQFFSSKRTNRLHEYLGSELIGDLIQKYKLQGYTFEPFKNKRGGEWVFNKDIIPKNSVEKIKELNKSIAKTESKLKELKLETVFYNPAKDRLVYFGEAPKSATDLKKAIKKRGFNSGGMVGISHLTRPLGNF